MSKRRKFLQSDFDSAVKRYASGESARALAREIKCSVPTMYKEINIAKVAAAEETRRAAMSPETFKLESRLNRDLLLKVQARQISALQKRLFEMMVKHGEL